MDTNRIRQSLYTAYPCEKWSKKIDDMSDSQVIAVYYSFQKRGKFDSKPELAETIMNLPKLTQLSMFDLLDVSKIDGNALNSDIKTNDDFYVIDLAIDITNVTLDPVDDMYFVSKHKCLKTLDFGDHIRIFDYELFRYVLGVDAFKTKEEAETHAKILNNKFKNKTEVL